MAPTTLQDQNIFPNANLYNRDELRKLHDECKKRGGSLNAMVMALLDATIDFRSASVPTGVFAKIRNATNKDADLKKPLTKIRLALQKAETQLLFYKNSDSEYDILTAAIAYCAASVSERIDSLAKENDKLAGLFRQDKLLAQFVSDYKKKHSPQLAENATQETSRLAKFTRPFRDFFRPKPQTPKPVAAKTAEIEIDAIELEERKEKDILIPDADLKDLDKTLGAGKFGVAKLFNYSGNNTDIRDSLCNEQGNTVIKAPTSGETSAAILFGQEQKIIQHLYDEHKKSGQTDHKYNLGSKAIYKGQDIIISKPEMFSKTESYSLQSFLENAAKVIGPQSPKTTDAEPLAYLTAFQSDRDVFLGQIPSSMYGSMQAIHQAGVYHCDIGMRNFVMSKPEMDGDNPKKFSVVALDYGFARLVQDNGLSEKDLDRGGIYPVYSIDNGILNASDHAAPCSVATDLYGIKVALLELMSKELGLASQSAIYIGDPKQKLEDFFPKRMGMTNTASLTIYLQNLQNFANNCPDETAKNRVITFMKSFADYIVSMPDESPYPENDKIACKARIENEKKADRQIFLEANVKFFKNTLADKINRLDVNNEDSKKAFLLSVQRLMQIDVSPAFENSPEYKNLKGPLNVANFNAILTAAKAIGAAKPAEVFVALQKQQTAATTTNTMSNAYANLVKDTEAHVTVPQTQATNVQTNAYGQIISKKSTAEKEQPKKPLTSEQLTTLETIAPTSPDKPSEAKKPIKPIPMEPPEELPPAPELTAEEKEYYAKSAEEIARYGQLPSTDKAVELTEDEKKQYAELTNLTKKAKAENQKPKQPAATTGEKFVYEVMPSVKSTSEKSPYGRTTESIRQIQQSTARLKQLAEMGIDIKDIKKCSNDVKVYAQEIKRLQEAFESKCVLSVFNGHRTTIDWPIDSDTIIPMFNDNAKAISQHRAKLDLLEIATRYPEAYLPAVGTTMQQSLPIEITKIDTYARDLRTLELRTKTIYTHTLEKLDLLKASADGLRGRAASYLEAMADKSLKQPTTDQLTKLHIDTDDINVQIAHLEKLSNTLITVADDYKVPEDICDVLKKSLQEAKAATESMKKNQIEVGTKSPALVGLAISSNSTMPILETSRTRSVSAPEKVAKKKVTSAKEVEYKPSAEERQRSATAPVKPTKALKAESPTAEIKPRSSTNAPAWIPLEDGRAKKQIGKLSYHKTAEAMVYERPDDYLEDTAEKAEKDRTRTRDNKETVFDYIKDRQYTEEEKDVCEDMAREYLKTNPKAAYLTGNDNLAEKTAFYMRALDKKVEIYVNNKLYDPSFLDKIRIRLETPKLQERENAKGKGREAPEPESPTPFKKQKH